jgi:phosphatidylserine/phosphatidylglycerophosphate/cardiolipin synthase-like enzyme
MTTKVLATRAFNRQFRDCLARGPVSLLIVSPFMKAYPPWKDVFAFCEFAIKRGISNVTIVTTPPGWHAAALSKSEADLIESAGIDLRIRASKLHSKVYFFVYEGQSYTAFVGSANFTQGGFVDNDETMAMMQRLEDRPEIQREVDRLTTYGSFPYSSWKANRKLAPLGGFTP